MNRYELESLLEAARTLNPPSVVMPQPQSQPATHQRTLIAKRKSKP